MNTQMCLLPFALSDLFAQVACSRCITLADRYGLLAAILDESLDEEHRNAINRLLRAIAKGRMKVVSELSAVIN